MEFEVAPHTRPYRCVCTLSIEFIEIALGQTLQRYLGREGRTALPEIATASGNEIELHARCLKVKRIRALPVPYRSADERYPFPCDVQRQVDVSRRYFVPAIGTQYLKRMPHVLGVGARPSYESLRSIHTSRSRGYFC